MKIRKLCVNHIENAVGYDLSRLSLSWIAESDGRRQEASRVEISLTPDFQQTLFDSGWRIVNNLDYCPKYDSGENFKLSSYTKYYWRVSVKADNGDLGTSEVSYFETAKRKEDWVGKWICAPFDAHPIFKSHFRAKAGEKARIYLCGLGLYEVYCNGKKVGNEVLLPGYHSYDFRLMYQSFVLEDYLINGENVLTIMLAPGWYMGRFGFNGGATNMYGDQMTMICEVHVEGKLILTSNEEWECTKSPVLESNIYDGEVWDARLEAENTWYKAKLLETALASQMTKRLVERTNPSVSIVETIKPVEIIKTKNGDTVLDFGQNMAGWFTFTCNEPKDKKICVECAELMQEGEFYRENLRTAKAMLTYISKGEKTRVRPHFTFFGFRYLKVSGLSDLEDADFTALALSSVVERTGIFKTSDSLVNRLIDNARWGQLGNFIEVPTDCPQRDERMGWTGDTQIFSATACYQYDSAAFYAKYMQDVWLEQQVIGGSVPFIVPSPKVDLMPGVRQSSGSCAWSDVATILPWTLYQFYGNKSLLEEEYASMKAWVEFIRTQESKENLWESGFHFADWLALDNPNPGPMGKTDPYYCASGYYYYTTLLVSKAADVLGYETDAQFYASLAQDIKISFCKKYFDDQGNCIVDTQTAYVLALMFDLCEEQHRDDLAKALHQKLVENQMHLDTGFVGTGYLCKVLAKVGLQKDAVSLLLQKEMPGWLYQVIMGATTIWERWNSILPDGTINPEGMNSLNHYAYGAICQWIYEDLCGISPKEPGFKKVVFAPKTDERFSFVTGIYHSAMGTYKYGWQKTQEGYYFFIHVPFDCSAIISIPGCKEEEVLSGSYEFTCN